jgi:hypothetical protein
MSQAALKLVAVDPADSDVLRFERRQTSRHNICGCVTSLQKSPGLGTEGNRISSLQLLNISDTGMGGVLQEPVELGTSISAFFPPHGPEHGFDRYGYVVRCTQISNGYEVGIRFISRAAA